MEEEVDHVDFVSVDRDSGKNRGLMREVLVEQRGL